MISYFDDYQYVRGLTLFLDQFLNFQSENAKDYYDYFFLYPSQKSKREKTLKLNSTTIVRSLKGASPFL